MARLISRILGRKEAKETKEANERLDQPGGLSEGILAASEERSQLRATIERVSQEAERRDHRIRADARAAAAALKLRRPGQRRREARDSEQSAETRHAESMQRGLERIGKLTATFRFALDKDSLESLAARAVQETKPDGASGRHEERGTTELETPVLGESEALKERGESREVAGPFQLRLAELGQLLQARFGNLDVINKSIPGSVDSSSGAPLDGWPRERKPDGERDRPKSEETKSDAGGPGTTKPNDSPNKAAGVGSDATKPEGTPQVEGSGPSESATAPGGDKGDGREKG